MDSAVKRPAHVGINREITDIYGEAVAEMAGGLVKKSLHMGHEIVVIAREAAPALQRGADILNRQRRLLIK
jgi:hypothetical protein